MFNTGDKVNLCRLPDDNNRWCLPARLIGKTGTFVEIGTTFRNNDTYLVDFGCGNPQVWRIPRYDESGFQLIKLNVINKWNPLNYKSHFKPVKLP